MHRVYVGDSVKGFVAGQEIVISGQEATHLLRVKRFGPGDEIELMDGSGSMGRGCVVEAVSASDRKGERQVLGEGRRKKAGRGGKDARDVVVRVEEVRSEGPMRLRIEICSATPKGGRVDEMIEQLSQVGASSWMPMRCVRSVVEPRESKLDRLRRIAIESAKQCGRLWLMEIQEESEFEEVVRESEGDAGTQDASTTLVCLADREGEPMPKVLAYARERGELSCVRVLIGPEGGFDDRELEMAQRLGVKRVCLGSHIMRIETAAVAAAAITDVCLRSFGEK